MLFFKKMTIRKKITIPTILLLLVIIAVLGFISFLLPLQAMQKQLEETVPQMAIYSGKIIENKLNAYQLSMEGVASQNAIRSMDWNQQLAAMQRETKRMGIIRLGIVDMNGNARYNDGTTSSLKDREYFKTAAQGKSVFSDIIISRVTNLPVMMIAVPVMDTQNTISAVLTGTLDGAWLSDISDKIKYGENGYAYIIDNKGTMIAHQNRDYVLKQKNFIEESRSDPQYAKLASMFQKMIRKETGYDEYPFMGSVRFFGFAPIEGTNWSIAVGAPKEYVFGRISSMRIYYLLLSLFAVCTSIVVSLFLSRAIVSPIQKASAMLKDISEGEGDLTKRLEINTNDEIGDMSRYFNNFTQKLQTMIKSIAENANVVVSSATALSEVAIKIDANAHEMSKLTETATTGTENATSKISNISASAEEMSSASMTVATAIEEMSVTLNEVARNCQNELQIADKANSNAQNSKDIMDKLSLAAKSIGKVVDVINDIADQTNLLALNATIEAASAGDAGKGFAVVASEVKELARQTTQATQDIIHQVNEMQGNTDSAVKSIEEVTQVIGEVNRISQSIVSAVEEQSSTVNEISKNVSGVSEGARNVAQNVAESARGLSEIASTISSVSGEVTSTANGTAQVKSSAEELKKFSDNLRSLLAQFKV